MGELKFDIRYPNGHRDQTVVEGERALIGSAAHCEVRLPMDQAAYEHLLIEVSGRTVRAQALAEQPPATINGMRLTTSTVAPDAPLGAGDIRIFVSYGDDLEEGTSQLGKDKKESSPLVRIVALIALPIAGYMVLLDQEPLLGRAPTESIDLFTQAKPACPQSTPGEAMAIADEKLDQATAKRERMPFAPREGMDAVVLYDTAAACFEVGRSSASAKDARDTAEALRQTITRDFRTRRLRLTRMLQIEDYELAAQDVAALQAMTEGKQGKLVNWLSSTQRQLKSKVKT